jgi:long-subunit acyl-CoA synthetase (AMP-forming)
MIRYSSRSYQIIVSIAAQIGSLLACDVALAASPFRRAGAAPRGGPPRAAAYLSARHRAVVRRAGGRRLHPAARESRSPTDTPPTLLHDFFNWREQCPKDLAQCAVVPEQRERATSAAALVGRIHKATSRAGAAKVLGQLRQKLEVPDGEVSAADSNLTAPAQARGLRRLWRRRGDKRALQAMAAEARALYSEKIERTRQTVDEMGSDVHGFALYLRSLGLEHDDRVASLSSPNPYEKVALMGAQLAGGIAAPVYEKSLFQGKEEQFAPNARDSLALVRPKVMVVEDAQTAREVFRDENTGNDLAMLPHTIEKLIVLHGEVPAHWGARAVSYGTVQAEGRRLVNPDRLPAGQSVRDLLAQLQDDKWASITFTSGTTGKPKAVVATHGALARDIRRAGPHHRFAEPPSAELRRSGRAAPYASSEFLTSAHIAGDELAKLAMHLQRTAYFAPDKTALPAELRYVGPRAVLLVPMMWNRIRKEIIAGVKAQPKAKQDIAWWAHAKNVELQKKRLAGERLSVQERAQQLLVDYVTGEVRKKLPLDGQEILASGAARLDPKLKEFLLGWGYRIHEAFGSTETGMIAGSLARHPDELDSVGSPYPGVRLAIDRDGQLWVRQERPHERRYWNGDGPADAIAQRNPQLPEGYWVPTGDLAEIVPQSRAARRSRKPSWRRSADDVVRPAIRIRGRLVDHIKLSNGSFFGAEQVQETVERNIPWVERAVVVNDGSESGVTLMVFPDEATLSKLGEADVTGQSLADDHPLVKQLRKSLPELLKSCPGTSSKVAVAGVAVLAQPFPGTFLTPTLKVARVALSGEASPFRPTIDRLKSVAQGE